MVELLGRGEHPPQLRHSRDRPQHAADHIHSPLFPKGDIPPQLFDHFHLLIHQPPGDVQGGTLGDLQRDLSLEMDRQTNEKLRRLFWLAGGAQHRQQNGKRRLLLDIRSTRPITPCLGPLHNFASFSIDFFFIYLFIRIPVIFLFRILILARRR